MYLDKVAVQLMNYQRIIYIHMYIILYLKLKLKQYMLSEGHLLRQSSRSTDE